MVDVVFRGVDPATLRSLVEPLGSSTFEIESTEHAPWTADIAERILRRATLRASRVTRAIVDGGGEITVAAAVEAVEDVAPQHAVASLTSAWRSMHRNPGLFDIRDPLPDRRPVEAVTDGHGGGATGRLSGYRMDPSVLPAFTAALDSLGRKPP